jgi:hypothetical protein
MTREEVKEFVEGNINRMAREFGLGDWRIRLDFPKGFDRTGNFQVDGRCHSDFKRQKALIEIWADSFEDCSEQELRETVEHELLHLCHAGIDDAMDTAFALLDDDEAPVFDRAMNLGYELTVRALEKLVAGIRAASRHQATADNVDSLIERMDCMASSPTDSLPQAVSRDQSASV